MATRRQFLKTATAGGLLGSLSPPLLSLRPVSGREADLGTGMVRFGNGIEPLVRLIEDTPREKLIEEVAVLVRGGLPYRKLLAALLLAGVRNVEPRPSVGFKFHAVLVVNSAHLASISSSDEDRWLPIFWTLDNFKSSQAQDVREGNWTMPAVDEASVPMSNRAGEMFAEAMDQWDEAKADVAVAGLSRTVGANQVFELFARYGARDFRSIGHKAIFVANSYRTLQCIGWHHAEPVLRSLAYALLNHRGSPNPATNDLDADRPWRKNLVRANTIRADWLSGSIDAGATEQLIDAFRSGSADELCEQAIEMLNAGVSPQSIYDAVFLAAGELLIRKPGIVALHAVTSTNALRYAFKTVTNDNTRRMLLLQNVAFLPMFRAEMGDSDITGKEINHLAASTGAADAKSLETIFRDVSADPQSAARQTLGYLQSDGKAEEFMTAARRLIFLKGTNSHDYKFSSAILEDFYQVSPPWRDRYLASSVFQLRGSQAKDNGLIQRIRSAIGT